MPSVSVSVFSLWLPILLAAVVVFIASFLAWMVLPHHKPDFKGLQNEDEFLAGIRARKPEPGQYAFPFCDDYAKMKDPEFKKRMDTGPHGMLMVWPGPPNMGKALALTFVFYLVVGFCVAYLASFHLGRGADFMPVFRFTGAAAIMIYTLGFIPNAIWFGRTRRSVVMDVIDCVVYGFLTGLVFAILWPAAESIITVLAP
ncbi:MAG: hypothetical protein ACYTGG_10040 [Planctomycetota bacterium]|jgi:hypothetical protein